MTVIVGSREMIIYYPMIPVADSECTDQTVQMHGCIWAFAVRVCPRKRSGLNTHYFIEIALMHKCR